MYEPSLVVIAATASVLAGERVMRRWKEEGVLRLSVLLPLVLAWSLLPLSRPDAFGSLCSRRWSSGHVAP